MIDQPHIAAGIYDRPPFELAAAPRDAVQLCPLIPGSTALESLVPGSLQSLAMAAPSGTMERRTVLALALRAMAPGGEFVAVAPKDKGGMRLKKELESFGCRVEESSKAHYRICRVHRDGLLHGVGKAIEDGSLRLVMPLGLHSQPGIFSWDHADLGTEALFECMLPLAGRGADFGCGTGIIARRVLESADVGELTLIDIDRRAVAAARLNVIDPRARFLWADLREGAHGLAGLDFVVTNPPFHDGGQEDRKLGQLFIARAAEVLKPEGIFWLTANRHLPYEAMLEKNFRAVALVSEIEGYKVLEARK